MIWKNVAFLGAVGAIGAAAARQSGYYGAASTVLAPALMVAATGLLAFAKRWKGVEGTSGLGLLCLLLGSGFLIWLPGLQLCAFLIAAGSGALMIARTTSRDAAPRVQGFVVSWGSSAILAGVGYLLCAGSYPLYERLELLRPLTGLATQIVALPPQIFGIETHVAGTEVLLNTPFGSGRVAVDWWRLGGVLLFNIILVQVLFTLVVGGGRALLRSSVPFIGFVALYAALRWLVVSVLCLQSTPDLRMAVNTDAIFLSFAPLLLLMTPFAQRLAADFASSSITRRAHRPVAGLAAATLGAIALTTSLHYFDGGIRRAGGVLLDEAHSQWERTDIKFDREKYGKYTTYNYSMFADILDRRYSYSVNREKALTGELLQGIQVLVLKTPTHPYSPAEISTVLDFVERGGGLWLIGDHTNLMGMGEILNRFAEPLGFRFGYDSTYEMRSGQPTFNDVVGPLHPTGVGTEGMSFQTSCSLEVLSPRVVPAMIGRTMTSEYADFGHPNFFSNMRTDTFDRVGLFAQALSVTHGQGRVVAFSDSTIFSNFAIAEVGVPELVRNSVEYLMCSERLFDGWHLVLGGFGLLLLLVGIVWLGGGPFVLPALPIVLCALLSTVLATRFEAHACTLVNRPGDELAPYRIISFPRDASYTKTTSFLDEVYADATHDGGPASISTFHTWTMRLGNTFPRSQATLLQAIDENPEVLVVYDTPRGPSPHEITALYTYTMKGGVLLVMTNVNRVGETHTDQWLRPFSLSLERTSTAVKIHRAASDVHLMVTGSIPALAPTETVLDILDQQHARPGALVGTTDDINRVGIGGGVPLFVDETGLVVGAYKRRGRGAVMAYTLSRGLSTRMLGSRYEPPPDQERQARYEVAYAVMEEALKLSGKKPRRSE